MKETYNRKSTTCDQQVQLPEGNLHTLLSKQPEHHCTESANIRQLFNIMYSTLKNSFQQKLYISWCQTKRTSGTSNSLEYGCTSIERSRSSSEVDFPCPRMSMATTRAFSLILLADKANESLPINNEKHNVSLPIQNIPKRA